jgi:hypothetical protein
MELIVRL